jgi:hypothetical protein
LLESFEDRGQEVRAFVGVRAKGGVYVATEIGILAREDVTDAREVGLCEDRLHTPVKIAPRVGIAGAGSASVGPIRRFGPLAVA